MSGNIPIVNLFTFLFAQKNDKIVYRMKLKIDLWRSRNLPQFRETVSLHLFCP